MRGLLGWIWDRGIVGTFLAGFFVILPLVITAAVVAWLGGMLGEWLGPESMVGKGLHSLGLRFVADERLALFIGWIVLLAAIWSLGLFVRATARFKLREAWDRLLNRIPIVKTVYSPVAQVVGLLQQQDKNAIKGMSVVWCGFAELHGGGFLGLLASSTTYRFDGKDCLLVYMPTSPVPMTGGLIFIPSSLVKPVDMNVDELMQVYFSLGVLSSGAVPACYQVPAAPVA